MSAAPSNAGRFRFRLLIAMMVLVASVTTLAVIVAQRNVGENFASEMKRDFQSQTAAMRNVREVRQSLLAERCRQLVGKSRIVAAFEDDALDLLYAKARDELQDVLPNDDRADRGQLYTLRGRFFRFLNEKGAVIPTKGDDLARLGITERDLALPSLPDEPQLGYVWARDAAHGENIDEIIATPIFSRTTNTYVAALVLGFRPIEVSGSGPGKNEIKSGIWLGGRLHLPGLPQDSAEAITAEVNRSRLARTSPAKNPAVDVGGVPHLLFYEQLNPGSAYPPAYEVCLYSMADTLARQSAVRWEIVGIGALLLVAGLFASDALAVRLSKPVETLEVVSAENVVRRERVEAALEITHEELRVRNAELQKALADLESAQQSVIQQERLRALGQMASGIAHDFNNALVPILGFCELLQLSPEVLGDRKKCLGYLETIQTAAKDASSIVARLREFYRANDADEKFAAVKLTKLVDQAVKLTRPKWKDQALANGATVKIVADLQDREPVLGEESALREVLTNLIFNAVDAMPAGGTITIRTRCASDRGVIEVEDSGTGMTEEVRRRCLEPFFSTKGERGTGLGLSMVFGIIQRHEGTIDLQSEIGRGTTFILSLPLYRESEVAATVETAVKARVLRVLVVDDEAPVRAMLTAALTHDGHDVQIAEQGVEGLRSFMAGKFDLVVTDKAMPGMSGDQMAAAIKQIAPQTPIILLTGFGQFLDKESFPSVDVLAAKPIGINALREAITRALATAA